MALESTFSAQVRKDLKKIYPKAFVQLHMDAPRSGKKPYDAYIVHKGRHIGMEFKKTEGNSINFDRVTGNQIDFLNQLKESEGASLIIVWFVKYNCSYIIDIEVWNDIVHTFNDEGHTNISIKALNDKDMNNLLYKMDRVKIDRKLTWQVERIVEASKVKEWG